MHQIVLWFEEKTYILTRQRYLPETLPDKAERSGWTTEDASIQASVGLMTIIECYYNILRSSVTDMSFHSSVHCWGMGADITL